MMRKKVFLLSLVLISTFVVSGCSVLQKANKKTGLQITTEGSQAAVFLNDQYVNNTPFVDKNLQPGKYSVRLEPTEEGLAPYETTITLRAGALSAIVWKFGETIELSSGSIYEMEVIESSHASFSVQTIPDNAIFKLDDQPGELTPFIIDELSAGDHSYEVVAASYLPLKHTVQLTSGYRTNVVVKLARDPAHFVNVNQLENEYASQSAYIDAVTIPEATAEPTASISASLNTISRVKILTTTTGWLRVRSSPSSSGEELAQVDTGEVFPHQKTENGWHQIEYESGKMGWVSGQYSEVLPPVAN